MTKLGIVVTDLNKSKSMVGTLDKVRFHLLKVIKLYSKYLETNMERQRDPGQPCHNNFSVKNCSIKWIMLMSIESDIQIHIVTHDFDIQYCDNKYIKNV